MSIALDLALLLRDSFNNFNLSLATIGVAYTLAFRIGSNTNTWVSQSTLAEELKITERMVKKHCAYLKLNRLIIVKKDSTDNRRNVYNFNPNILNYHAKKDGDKQKTLRLLGDEPLEKGNFSSPISEDRGTLVHLNTGTLVPLLCENEPLPSLTPPNENELSTVPKGKKQRNIKSKEPIYCSSGDERDRLFDEFWNCYPRKQGRLKATRAWNKAIKIETPQKIIADVKIRCTDHEQWQTLQFVPLASTYLNNQLWTDQLITKEMKKHVRSESVAEKCSRLTRESYERDLQFERHAENVRTPDATHELDYNPVSAFSGHLAG